VPRSVKLGAKALSDVPTTGKADLWKHVYFVIRNSERLDNLRSIAHAVGYGRGLGYARSFGTLIDDQTANWWLVAEKTYA
jgi:hypothetical protein